MTAAVVADAHWRSRTTHTYTHYQVCARHHDDEMPHRQVPGVHPMRLSRLQRVEGELVLA